MQEIICLLSSSPPRLSRQPSRDAAPAQATVSAEGTETARFMEKIPVMKKQTDFIELDDEDSDIELSFDPRLKTSCNLGISITQKSTATMNIAVAAIKEKDNMRTINVTRPLSTNTSDLIAAKSTAIVTATESLGFTTEAEKQKQTQRDYVFLDDDENWPSSSINLDSEYSLHIEEARARPANRVGSKLGAEVMGAAAPVSPVGNRLAKTGTLDGAQENMERGRRKEAKEKIHENLDGLFSDSIDLDKEYSLHLNEARARPANKVFSKSPPKSTTGAASRLQNGSLSPKCPRWTSATTADASNVTNDYNDLDDPFPSSINLEHPLPNRTTKTYYSDPFAEPGDDMGDSPATKLPELPKPRTSNLMQRATSDVSLLATNTNNRPNTTTAGAGAKKGVKRTATMVLDSDPITFTSSPDFAQMERDRRKRRDTSRKKPVELSDLEEEAAPAAKLPALAVLDSDSDDLPELPRLGMGAKRSNTRVFGRASSDVSYNKTASKSSLSKSLARSTSLANPATKGANKRVPKTAEEKAAEIAAKHAAKEEEAEKRKNIREEKARDKVIAADLAKVNTLKTDKKKSTPEMVVIFPMEMDEKLREQAERFLGKLGVETRPWRGANVAGGGGVRNVVRWKRKVEAKYDEDADIWRPVPLRVEEEKHVLVYMLAKEFVELVTGEKEQDLDAHVGRMKSKLQDCKIIYLIEGLITWQKRNKNVRNRQYEAAVRAQTPAEAPTSTQRSSKSKRKAPEYIDDDLIEDSLLRLQVIHKVLIHHTTAFVESAEWISIFTQHISTIPYRKQKMNMDTSFCMDTGQVRVGEDARDTFVKMLCEMRGLTAPVAWGVEQEVKGREGAGGVVGLMKWLREEGREAIADVRKSANKDGAFTDRKVGRAMSKRVYSVFMGNDPGSTEV